MVSVVVAQILIVEWSRADYQWKSRERKDFKILLKVSQKLDPKS